MRSSTASAMSAQSTKGKTVDVNETLASIRKRIEWMREAYDRDDHDTAAAEGDLIATEFEGLDRWIRRGGSLPADWQRR